MRRETFTKRQGRGGHSLAETMALIQSGPHELSLIVDLVQNRGVAFESEGLNERNRDQPTMGLLIEWFRSMSILYPKIRLTCLPTMFGYAALGGLVAGLYGTLHDQVTYSISHEYFTRLKFAQFWYLDFGLPARVFVAEIGFLATWWVGFIAAWFIARITVPSFPPGKAFQYSLRGFLIILAFAFTTPIVGYLLGIMHGTDYKGWEEFASALGVQDLPSFVRVAYIHNASYVGGLLGLVFAIIRLRRLRPSKPAAADYA